MNIRSRSGSIKLAGMSRAGPPSSWGAFEPAGVLTSSVRLTQANQARVDARRYFVEPGKSEKSDLTAQNKVSMVVGVPRKRGLLGGGWVAVGACFLRTQQGVWISQCQVMACHPMV